MDKQIEALLAERAGYVVRRLPARVAAVDEALRALGYKSAPTVETATVEPDAERATNTKRAKRTAD